MPRRFSPVQLFATPWTTAHQASLSMGFYRKECWNELQRPPAGDVPDPWMKFISLMSPALAGKLLTTTATTEAADFQTHSLKH